MVHDSKEKWMGNQRRALRSDTRRELPSDRMDTKDRRALRSDHRRSLPSDKKDTKDRRALRSDHRRELEDGERVIIVTDCSDTKETGISLKTRLEDFAPKKYHDDALHGLRSLR